MQKHNDLAFKSAAKLLLVHNAGLIYSPLWRDADCADEQSRLLFNNDVNQFTEFTFGVVFVGLARICPANLWQ